MCRMFATYGNIPIIKDLLFEFQKLSVTGRYVKDGKEGRGHPDGWGLATKYNGNPTLIQYKNYISAHIDPEYKKLIQKIPDQGVNIILAHLRLATNGIPVNLANAHPFQIVNNGNQLTFMHNGTVFHPEAFPNIENYPESESDTQRLLNYLTHNLDLQSTTNQSPRFLPSDGLVKKLIYFIHQVPKYSNFTSITSVLIINNDLFAIRYYNKNPDYYTLWYYLWNEDSVIISSQPLEHDNLTKTKWYEIPNRRLLHLSGNEFPVLRSFAI